MTKKDTPPPRPLPGDMPHQERIERMIRVDHAGEYGAARIYDGQLAILGHRHRFSPAIRHMAEQERKHLAAFDQLVNERKVRPTLLGPVWHVAGFALGAATALMGEKAAMACTAAVEEVIDEHYGGQLDQLTAMDEQDEELMETVEQFRADEAEHRDTAIKHGARETPGYSLLSAFIKTGSRTAIWLSKRL